MRILRILAVNPRVAFPNKCRIDIHTVNVNLSDRPPVAVHGHRNHPRPFAERQCCKRALGLHPEGLALLGNVDFGDAHLEPFPVLEDRERVAVGDVDDLALVDCRTGRGEGEDEE